MTIRRFSSRTQRLDQSFLLPHLRGARSYRRIAGYFTSSLFEVAHEYLDAIADVRIVCNVDLHLDDLKVAQLRAAQMIGRWNDNAIEAEALLNRDRYQRLDQFLARHGGAIRVAADSICGFLHGKAGVIECADGRKLGFIGSMNETRNGWQQHYEILWEDRSPEGVAWIEAEFEFLWNAARPLPEAVIREVNRRSRRHEIEVTAIEDDRDVAPAALIESPLYRQGWGLQPWQQGFVGECITHYQNHGTVRLLLADEVGLGKTLALATAALALCLLQQKAGRRPKPILILAPATLCEQWQTELLDKLGMPCARWDTLKKQWRDHDARLISPPGQDQISHCPLRIGIVSTGLMLRDSLEKQYLLGLRYTLVILDEAHKARSRKGFGRDAGTPNELLAFMRDLAARADHLLLGTATPIQTNPADLWDLLGILHQGSERRVLGHEGSPWHDPDQVLPILSGQQEITEPAHAWELLRSPLPLVNTTSEPQARKLYSAIRSDLGLTNTQYHAGHFSALSQDTREDLEDLLHRRLAGVPFFQRENPVVRHVVLRKRSTLEAQGLLKRIRVDIHPDSALSREPQAFHVLFEGLALRISEDFRSAYAEAGQFGQALRQRGQGGGFMQNLMQQRICSSIVAGLNTATTLLQGHALQEEHDEQAVDLTLESTEERRLLERLIQRLERVTSDPKLCAIQHYLDQEHWLEQGVIIFSQYYDTARWVADALAEHYPDETIGLYAGAGRSRLYRQGDSVSSERETLKRQVAERQIRIMVATDAACEGLNLQTLGTLINVDLPWNPTKLEQRIGRIKRFGQVRDKVDMLNLVNAQTVDEKVYERLSERMQDRYNLFGALPDTIKDEWIENIATLGEKMDEYINAQQQANGFDLRYNTTLTASDQDWRHCAAVLSRQDFITLMSEGW